MHKEKEALLRQQSLFSLSDDRVIAKASAMLRIAQFKAGDRICFQGDPQSPLVFVISGWLRSSTVSEEGSEVPVRMVYPGQSAGEAAIVKGVPIIVNIEVIEDSEVGLFNRSDATELLKEPSISRALSTILASQVQYLVTRHAAKESPRADSRISAIIESALDGIKGETTPLIELPDQATIAAMAKVSRETVSRVLRSLEDRGVIAKDGRRIRICDRLRLRNLAAG